MSTVIRFGLGNYGVDIGTLGGEPCVFVIPNEKPGPVGERIPLSEQGPLELDSLPDGWTVLLFPTREQCKNAADALVGSKLDRWTGDEYDERPGNPYRHGCDPAIKDAIETFQSFGCPVCSGDCGSANPPVYDCPMQKADKALRGLGK